MSSTQEFETAFERARLRPAPSLPPGLSYEFLFAAWEDAGRPRDIETFLIHGKTIEPGRRNAAHA